MFGTNPIRKIEARTDSLWVHSIFPTIQGEGPYAGQRAVFLRLGGCSLACSWCDTEFEEECERIENAKLADLLDEERVNAPCAGDLCVITGGEPMRQNIAPLVQDLVLTRGWRVQVETAGVHWWEGFPSTVGNGLAFVCSPKTPKVNKFLEEVCRAWKYIIDAREEHAPDGLPKHAVSQAGRPNTGALFRPSVFNHHHIFVQPLHLPTDEDQTQRNIERCVELTLKHGYRLSLQQHKLLGLP